MAIIPLGTVATGNYGSATKTASLAVNVTRAVPAGHTLAIFVAQEGSGGVTSSFTATDARGNTYAAGPVISDTSSRMVGSLIVPVTNALSSGDAITITSSQTRGRWAVVVEEISGLVASAIDVSASTTGTSATLTSGTTSATAQNDEIVYAAFSHGPLNSFTAGSGFTAGGTAVTTAGSNEHKISTEYKVLTTTGAQSSAATQSGSSSFAGIQIALKGAVTVTTAADGASGTSWTLTGASATAALGDASDTTFEKSPDNATGVNPLTITFATPSSPPSSGQSVTFYLRLWHVGASTASVVVKVRHSSTTIVKTFSAQTVTSSPTDYAFTLDPTSVSTITSADSTWASVDCQVFATATP